MLENSLARPVGHLGLLNHTRALAKICLFFALALVFICHHQLITLIVWNKEKRLRYFLKSIKSYSQHTLKLLGIKIESQEKPMLACGKLFICNHLSYIDALVLFSYYPSLFVTSKEIQRTFFLGKLATLGGCFFVERRKDLLTEESKQSELMEMKEKLLQGFSVFLFPEGTSTDGRTIRTFKAHFFQLAFDNKVHIQPLLLKYKGKSSNIIPWYGDMTFVDHLYKVCLQKESLVKLLGLHLVNGALYDDKFTLANELHTLMLSEYEKH